MESQESSSNTKPKTNAIHVKGFPPTSTEDDIKKSLSQFGNILPSSVFKMNKGFAIIDFESSDSVDKAIDSSGKVNVAGSSVTISKVIKQQRRRKFKPAQRNTDRAAESTGSNKKVYVSPVPVDTTKEEVKDFFSRYGEITSAAVRIRKDQKGFAFITFATEEAAAKAVAETGNVSFKGEAVSLEFRKSGKRQSRNRKARGANDANATTTVTESNGDDKKALSSGKNKRRKKNKNKKEGQTAASTAQAEQPSGPTKNLHIRSIPFDTSAEVITGVFAKFGDILNAVPKVIPSAAFLDYATEEDRENVLKKAFETSKEEKTGSFGTAILRVFRSRGKKGDKTFSIGVKGFKGSQIPTEDDLRKIFPDVPISHITILPARSFAFVDFDNEASLNNALAAKVTLPGMAEPLQLEASKNGPQSKGNRRGGRRHFRRGPKAADDEQAE